MPNLYDATFIVAALFIFGIVVGNILHGVAMAIFLLFSVIIGGALWKKYHTFKAITLIVALYIGIYYAAVVHGDATQIKIPSLLQSAKASFEQQIKKILPQRQAALTLGLLLGAKNEFDTELKEEFKRSGTTHLVALSGYNIMIITTAIAGLLWWMPSFLQLTITLLAIVVFVMITGAESSLVRAAIMGILLLIAKHTGHVSSMRNIIVVTAAIMLLQNPKIIVFDVGFQLSFLALIGIVYIQPILEQWLPENMPLKNTVFVDSGLATIAAQIVVLPVLINTFGAFSWSSIVTNILIGMTVPYAMFVGFLTGTLGMMSTLLGKGIGFFAYLITSYELWVIHLGSMFGFVADARPWDTTIVLTYYAILLFIVIRHNKQQQQLLHETLHL